MATRPKTMHEVLNTTNVLLLVYFFQFPQVVANYTPISTSLELGTPI